MRLARIDPVQDGHCDQEDFAHFQRCHTGEDGEPPPAGCNDADLDDDGDVETDDFDQFNPCRSGASVPFNVNCVP